MSATTSIEPLVTVIICTWNRAASLQRTLESLVAMETLNSVPWEVVVVNNNSTDETDNVIDSFRGLLPICRVFESTPGLSNARNAGVAVARGMYIAWTDDDVVVSSNWLTSYVQAFLSNPTTAIFGGPINAVFEAPPPKWLKDGWHSVPSAFCQNDLSPTPVALSLKPGMVPFGANFAVRTAEQKIFPYDPLLGASPSGVYMGEETTVIRAILRNGGTGIWVPAANVQHVNSANRMTIEYLFDYYKKAGRTEAFLTGPQHGRTIFGRPSWLWRHIVEAGVSFYWSRAFAPSAIWLGKFSIFAVAAGKFSEMAVLNRVKPEGKSQAAHTTRPAEETADVEPILYSASKIETLNLSPEGI